MSDEPSLSRQGSRVSRISGRPPDALETSMMMSASVRTNEGKKDRRKSITAQPRKQVVLQKATELPVVQLAPRPHALTPRTEGSSSASSGSERGFHAWSHKHAGEGEQRIWSTGSMVKLTGGVGSRRGSCISYTHVQPFPEGIRNEAFRVLVRILDDKAKHECQRIFRETVIWNRWFDRVTLTLICLNCIFLALEDPTQSTDSDINQVGKYAEIVFTLCFLVEMVMKIIGLGLIKYPFSYLRDAWCVLDGTIVILGLITIATSSGIGGLRAFRLLKPLRAVNHLKEVRLIVTSLLQSLPRLGDVLLLFFFFSMLMSIIAIQMWAGALSKRCVIDEEYVGRASPMPAEDEGRACAGFDNIGMEGFQCPWGYACVRVDNPFFGKLSFDNIGIALLTLFTAVTMEGWSDTMYFVMDGASAWACLYFVVVILVGAFFISNLALVMISIAFFEAQEREEKKAERDALERDDASQGLLKYPPPRGESQSGPSGQRLSVSVTVPADVSPKAASGSLRDNHSNEKGDRGDNKRDPEDSEAGRSLSDVGRSVSFPAQPVDLAKKQKGEEGGILHRVNLKVKKVLYDAIRTKAFMLFITACILANTFAMAIEHHRQPKTMTDVLEAFNIIFTVIFAVESIVKLYTFDFKGEFVADRMNIFDAVIGFLGVADVLQERITGQRTGISVLRALRLARIFKQFKGLWMTTKTILQSLEGVSVLTLLLIMVIFVYGLFGMQLFGGKFCNLESPDTYVEWARDSCPLLPRSNFDHLGHATLAVFQVITGEDWNTVMYNGMRSGPNDAGNLYALYFVSLFLIGNVIVLNLFIAVLINNFGRDDDEEDDVSDPLDAITLPGHESQALQRVSNAICCCIPAAEAAIEPMEEPDDCLAPPCVARLMVLLLASPTDPSADALRELNAAAAESTAIVPDGMLIMIHLKAAGYDGAAGGFQTQLSEEAAAGLHGVIRSIYGEAVGSEARALPETVEELLAALDDLELAYDGWERLNEAVQAAGAKNPEVLIVLRRYGWATDCFLMPLTGITAQNLRADLEAQFRINCGDVGSQPVMGVVPAYFTQQAEGDEEGTFGLPLDRERKAAMQRIAQPAEQSAAFTHAGPTADWPDDGDKALWLLPMTNPVRRVLYFIATHRYFEAVVIFLILVSTVSLSIANPYAAPDELLPTINSYVDIVLTACFAAECLLKILAHGFVLHRSSYLRRDGWNRLDFLIVVFSMLSLLFSGASQLDVFRMMRTLRPLRFINKSEGLKMVVFALISSIPPLANIAFVTALVFSLFGILGKQFFSGSFYACSDVEWGDISYPPYGSNTTGIMQRHLCEAAGYRWENNRSNFDHLGAALLALFEVATLEGWVNLMHLGMDAVGPDEAPVKGNQPYMAIYFIIVIVIGSFFIINLFVGVLIDQYNAARDSNEEQKWAGLTDAQVQWMAVQDTILMNTPKMHKQEMSPWRMKLFGFVQHIYFNRFITGSIALNVGIMATEHFDQKPWVEQLLEFSNIFFITLFFLEAVLKLVAHSPVGYFRDYWNKYDFSLVVISCIGLIVQVRHLPCCEHHTTLSNTFHNKQPHSPHTVHHRRRDRRRRVQAFPPCTSREGGAQCCRSQIAPEDSVCLSLRSLLLSLAVVSGHPDRQPHTHHSIRSMGNLVNVAGLLSLFFFLYAVLGVDLFGRVARGRCINAHANFDHFGNAIMLLFRMSTGEAWQCVMGDARVESSPYCSNQLGNCGKSYVAVFYFMSFMAFGMYVMLNVFIAIILSGYECVAMEENALLNEDHVVEFYAEWEKRDPCGTRLMPISSVPGQIRALAPPLGYDTAEGTDPQARALFKKTLLLHIGNRCYSYDNQVCYQEVLMALVEFHLFKYGVGVIDPGHWEDMVSAYRRRWQEIHVENYDDELAALRGGKAKECLAAMQIQRIFRGRRGRILAREAREQPLSAVDVLTDARGPGVPPGPRRFSAAGRRRMRGSRCFSSVGRQQPRDGGPALCGGTPRAEGAAGAAVVDTVTPTRRQSGLRRVSLAVPEHTGGEHDHGGSGDSGGGGGHHEVALPGMLADPPGEGVEQPPRPLQPAPPLGERRRSCASFSSSSSGGGSGVPGGGGGGSGGGGGGNGACTPGGDGGVASETAPSEDPLAGCSDSSDPGYLAKLNRGVMSPVRVTHNGSSQFGPLGPPPQAGVSLPTMPPPGKLVPLPRSPSAGDAPVERG